MRQVLTIVGSAVFLVIAPGFVAGLVPWRGQCALSRTLRTWRASHHLRLRCASLGGWGCVGPWGDLAPDGKRRNFGGSLRKAAGCTINRTFGSKTERMHIENSCRRGKKWTPHTTSLRPYSL